MQMIRVSLLVVVVRELERSRLHDRTHDVSVVLPKSRNPVRSTLTLREPENVEEKNMVYILEHGTLLLPATFFSRSRSEQKWVHAYLYFRRYNSFIYWALMCTSITPGVRVLS